MKPIVFLLILLTLFSCRVEATGLGWYVYSFDWSFYEQDKQDIELSIKKCVTADEEASKWCGEEELMKRFVGTLDEKPTADLKYGVKDARPGDLELFAIGFFIEAYYYQIETNTFTNFEYFKSGRSEWKDQWVGCDDDIGITWNCINSYVLLKPSEVHAFKQEVDQLRTKKPRIDYQYFYEYLSALSMVLDTAAKNDRALFFHAMD